MRFSTIVFTLLVSGGFAARGLAAELPPALEAALARRDPAALADAAVPRLAALDSAQRATLEARLADRPVGERAAACEFLMVGAPYRLGALGEGSPPDTDPLVAFDTTDCTALQLVAATFAHASEPGGERAAMARAGYRDGVVSYATRLHFTTDRLDASPYFRDITRDVGGRACARARVTLNRRRSGARWIAIDWRRERTVAWLPRARARDLAATFDAGRLPAAVGIAFVHRAGLGDGLDVVHESLLWHGRTLVHASSRAGRVVAVPWRDYLDGPGRDADGVVLFEFR